MPSVNTTRTFDLFFLSPPSSVKSFSETISSPRSKRVCNITRRGSFFIFLTSFFWLKDSLLLKSFTNLAFRSNSTMPTRVVSRPISSCFRKLGRNCRSSNLEYCLRMLLERSINKPRSSPALHGGSVHEKGKRNFLLDYSFVILKLF